MPSCVLPIPVAPTTAVRVPGNSPPPRRSSRAAMPVESRTAISLCYLAPRDMRRVDRGQFCLHRLRILLDRTCVEDYDARVGLDPRFRSQLLQRANAGG